MNIVTCKCLGAQDALRMTDDGSGIVPSLVSCLGCLPATSRGIPVQALDLPAINPEAGVSFGQVVSSDWCASNPQFGLIRGRAGLGNDTFFMRDQSGYVWTVRTTEQGNFFVWQDPRRPQDAVQTLAELPAGIDRTEIGNVTKTIYVIRQIGQHLCLAFPAASMPWQEWRVHPDDRFLIFGDETSEQDILRHGSIFNCLTSEGFNLRARCVLRLR